MILEYGFCYKSIYQVAYQTVNSLTVFVMHCSIHSYSRGKKILEQLSRPRFFPGFEISRSSLRAKQVEKGREISNPVENRGLESCSTVISFSL